MLPSQLNVKGKEQRKEGRVLLLLDILKRKRKEIKQPEVVNNIPAVLAAFAIGRDWPPAEPLSRFTALSNKDKIVAYRNEND